jgi:hypothetical protein
MRRGSLVALLPALVLASVVACGEKRLPGPRLVGHPTSALVEVPYPPPPARIEAVPKAPTETAVWIDGEWMWQGKHWVWKAGRWVEPPRHAAFAPWTTVRDANGTLYFAAGTWRDATGAEVPEPAPIASARPHRGTVVNAEGEEVPPSPIASPERGAPRRSVEDGGVPEPDATPFPADAEPPSDAGMEDARIADAVAPTEPLPLAPDGGATTGRHR